MDRAAIPRTTPRPDGGVRECLIQAAYDEMTARGTAAIHMEAIARRAGVSRATAFRHLRSKSDALVQVALMRSAQHQAAIHNAMSTQAGAIAQLEAALVYVVGNLPDDPLISALIADHELSLHEPAVQHFAEVVLGSALRAGQRDGEIRSDVPAKDLIGYLLEQSYLACIEKDRSEAAVLRRVRRFVVPALTA